MFDACWGAMRETPPSKYSILGNVMKLPEISDWKNLVERKIMNFPGKVG